VDILTAWDTSDRIYDMTLAFLITTLSIFSLNLLLNMYSLSQQIKQFNVQKTQLITIGLNLIMLTFNILALIYR
jgi:hypothetical protein